MIINAIVAMSRNGYIGKDNQLMWHFKRDLRYFKRLTEGHVVIMGRKTYESIGKPLPNRINVVLTRNTDYNIPGVICVKHIHEALRVAKIAEDPSPFIIGGSKIYDLASNFIDRYYVTVIDKDYDGDVSFTLPKHFKETFSANVSEDGTLLNFKTYEKINGGKNDKDT